NARVVSTLRGAAETVLGNGPIVDTATQRSNPPARDGAIIGLFSGGTLAAEAQLMLIGAERPVASNVPVPGAHALTADGAPDDRILDLGADEFTRGRPHPMIDP